MPDPDLEANDTTLGGDPTNETAATGEDELVADLDEATIELAKSDEDVAEDVAAALAAEDAAGEGDEDAGGDDGDEDLGEEA